MRLDVYLAERGLAKSRSFAKTLIDEGYVSVNGRKAAKASLEVTDEDDVAVIGQPYEYVSRGGVKLEGALNAFGIDVSGAVCVDIGASTGGFTDCLLMRGAARVYAVDSGSGQLDEKLKADRRVINIENFNARYLTSADLGEMCDVAVTDVSFISQTLIHPAVKNVLRDGGFFVSLIKPQFECGREGLGKGGIVKNGKVLRDAVMKVVKSADENDLGCVGLIKSPVLGGDGNREFLMLCRPGQKRIITYSGLMEVCSE